MQAFQATSGRSRAKHLAQRSRADAHLDIGLWPMLADAGKCWWSMLAEAGANLTEVGPNLVDCGPSLVNSGNVVWIWSKSAQLGCRYGQTWPNSGQIFRAKFGRVWPMLVEVDRSLVDPKPNLLEVCRIRPKIGPKLCQIGRCWSKIVRHLGTSAPNSSELDRFRQTSACIPRICRELVSESYLRDAAKSSCPLSTPNM